MTFVHPKMTWKSVIQSRITSTPFLYGPGSSGTSMKKPAHPPWNMYTMYLQWLVGGIPTSLKNMKVNWDYCSQYMEKLNAHLNTPYIDYLGCVIMLPSSVICVFLKNMIPMNPHNLWSQILNHPSSYIITLEAMLKKSETLIYIYILYIMYVYNIYIMYIIYILCIYIYIVYIYIYYVYIYILCIYIYIMYIYIIIYIMYIYIL